MIWRQAQTIFDVYRHNGSAFANKPAFIMASGQSRTFGALFDRVTRLNNALITLGLKPGDRVGICSKNRIEYFESYGVSQSGLIPVPLNWRLAPSELLSVLKDSRPAAVICDSNFAGVIDSLREELGFVRHFVSYDDSSGQWDSYERLVWSSSAIARPIKERRADVACLLYTSGTTGAPKGAELTHLGLLGNCCSTIDEMLHLTSADTTLTPMPFFHVGGMWYHLFPSFAAGCTTVIVPDFNPALVLQKMDEYSVTNVHLVPTMIHALLREPAIKSVNLSHLRLIFYAASTMPVELLRRATAQFANVGFVQGYGSTEAGMVTCLTEDDHRQAARTGLSHLLSSCGRPLEGVNVSLRSVDEEDVGEIAVRSPKTMLGYWQNRAATDAIIKDGWLGTGDLGREDEQGYLYILDRKSDMIVTGGENVYPREVEDVILQNPEVDEVAVFDLPDDQWVQKVVAAIVPKSGAILDADKLIRETKLKLAGYKCPKEIFLVEALPKNGAGKIIRKVLRAKYSSQPAR